MSDKKKELRFVQAEPRRGRITVNILDEDQGLRKIEFVRAVRILSEEYVLLMMDDYSPTLGEVDGKVAFLTADDEITYDHIKGFYRLQNNEFTLVIKEK